MEVQLAENYTWKETELAFQVQILDQIVHVSLHTNTIKAWIQLSSPT